MTPEEMQAKLSYLLDRQAITDVICNYARSMDRFDKELFDTTYHPDAVDDHTAFVGDRDEFYTWASKVQGPDYRTSTQHLIANQTVEIDGDVAHAETYFVSYAMNVNNAPFSAIGGRYVDRLGKENGVWTIRQRAVLTDWEMPAVNTREAAEAAKNARPLAHMGERERQAAMTRLRPSRDRNDPSYQRPFNVPTERLDAYRAATQALAQG